MIGILLEEDTLHPVVAQRCGFSHQAGSAAMSQIKRPMGRTLAAG